MHTNPIDRFRAAVAQAAALAGDEAMRSAFDTLYAAVEQLLAALPKIETDHGVTYHPWIGPDGQVGYLVDDGDAGATTYLYLNPSPGDDEDDPNVFVYHGEHGNPGVDAALHYYRVRPDRVAPAGD